MKTTKMLRLFSTAALLAAVTAPAMAQEEAESGVFGVDGLEASVSLDVVSQYIFRGYEQADEGLIFQPGASVSLGLTDSDDLSVGVYVGAWESIHSVPATTASDSPASWYESDLYAGVTLSSGIFSADLGYIGYFYPSDVFSEIHEVALTVSIDDSEWLGKWAVNPYIMYAQEIENDNADENAYVEIGGAFSFDMAEEYDLPITWEVPFAVGLSADTYYVDAAGNEEDFGFASIGLIGTIPMSELIGTNDHIGSWDLYGGVTVYFLNNDVAMTDNTAHDDIQLVGSIGLGKSW